MKPQGFKQLPTSIGRLGQVPHRTIESGFDSRRVSLDEQIDEAAGSDNLDAQRAHLRHCQMGQIARHKKNPVIWRFRIIKQHQACGCHMFVASVN